jgi:trk system potassium uptake protein
VAGGSVWISVSGPPVQRRALNAGVVFAGGFSGLIVVGTLLLMLPISHSTGQWTSLLDAMFTATSAVAVTGLVVVDTGTYWSGFGQAVILALIQIGGLGFMTSSTLLLRLIGRRASLRERLLLQESQGGGAVGSALGLARRVLVFTLVIEGVGALMLTLAFLPERPLMEAVWWGVFHSITAFNNAGFDLTGGFRSVGMYQDAPHILLPLSFLVIFGALSYSVLEDVLRRRNFQQLTLDSKLVLVTSAALLVAGTVLLLFTERLNNATLGDMPLGVRVLNAFFLSAMARSGGFATFDLAVLSEGGLLILIALMLMGGSAGSTAGGIKVQTVGILVSASLSAIRGLPDVVAFERRVPIPNVLRAIAVAGMSVLLVFAMTFAISLTENQLFLRELFEVVSAAATVGLSTGLSVEASPAGRLILMAMMFIGRLGPLTLAIALAERERGSPLRWPAAAVRIG